MRLALYASPLLLFSVTSFAPHSSEAQTGDAEAKAVWTLPQLVRHALNNNQGLQASRLAIDVAKEDIDIAGGQRLPQVSAVSSLLHTPIRDRLLFERHGGRRDNPFQEDILNYGIQIRLPLYTGGRIKREIGLAEAVTAAAKSRSEVTKQELIFNITSAYYTHLRIRHDIAARETLIRSVEESRRIAQDQVEIGRAAKVEVLRLNARLSQAQSSLAVARNRLERTTATLKALISVPPDFQLGIGGTLTPAELIHDRKTAHAIALAMRPDLAAMRQQIKAQRQRVGIARARQLPSLDASASLGFATGADKTGPDTKFLLNLRLPLYTGGVLSAGKRKAFARLRQLETGLIAAERTVLAEVERAIIDVSSAQARMTASWQTIAPADETQRLEREKFQQGRGTGNDLLLAEEALLRARNEYAAAVADSQIAAASLRLATGDIDEPKK